MRGLGLLRMTCPFSLLAALQINTVLFFTQPSVSKLALLHGGQGWFSNKGCQAQGQRSEVASTAHGLCENKQWGSCITGNLQISLEEHPTSQGPQALRAWRQVPASGLRWAWTLGPTGHNYMSVHETKAWKKTHKTLHSISQQGG